MKKILGAVALLLLLNFSSISVFAQTAPTITNPTFSDDTNVHVPLQFGFPFYGRVFTNSWMHSNGVVSFLDPAVPIEGAPYNPGMGAYCCAGVPLNAQTGPQFSYLIAPLWTDLYPVQNSTFQTEGTAQYQIYRWNNIAEISNMNNLNSFSLEIRPSGFIGVNYTMINIQNQTMTAGTIGNPALGEFNQIRHGVGASSANLSNWTMDSTGSGCTTNPLLSPSCPGYAAAYFTQQCIVNPLYDSGCPGYATAYFNQQCTINPLYDVGCPGYAEAYYNQQCSLNPLYDSGCPGYTQAYYNQQCTNNPLYDSGCPGYKEAYALKYVVPNSNGSVSVTTTTQPEVKVASDGKVSSDVPLVSDTNVNNVITSRATSTTPSPSSPVSITQQQGGNQNNVSTQTNTQEKKSSSEQKTASPTPQQQRQQAQRQISQQAAKDEMKKVEQASSFESQVAAQNSIIGAMGFVPGFSAYAQANVPDVLADTVQKQYGKDAIDNRRALRLLGGGQDRLHREMIDGQYR